MTSQEMIEKLIKINEEYILTLEELSKSIVERKSLYGKPIIHKESINDSINIQKMVEKNKDIIKDIAVLSDIASQCHCIADASLSLISKGQKGEELLSNLYGDKISSIVNELIKNCELSAEKGGYELSTNQFMTESKYVVDEVASRLQLHGFGVTRNADDSKFVISF